MYTAESIRVTSLDYEATAKLVTAGKRKKLHQQLNITRIIRV